MAITINWGTKVINVPQSFLTLISGTSYQLDTVAFHIALKDLEDSEDGMAFPPTHNHNTAVTLGGIQYARIIEIINGYTITFEDGVYSVSLIGSNNNILDVANLNQVSVRANNSAGLINVVEVQVAAFNDGVTIDVTKTVTGTNYPFGTPASPVNNLADAKTIAVARGFNKLYIKGSLTLGATDVVTDYHIYGQGATFNVKKTIITLTAGCTTSNAYFYDLMIQGQQGGECHYVNCLIGALTKAHCHYDSCMMVGPIAFSSGVGSTHTTDLVSCYTSTSEYVVDAYDAVTLAYSQLKQVYNNFIGKIKFINFKNSGSIINLNITSGEVIIDSSCTAGTFNIRGNAVLTNNSGGSTVKTEGLVTENFTRIRQSIEAMRPSHPGFGTVFYVDTTAGKATNDGLSYVTPFLTFAAAHTAAVSGRGDVIQFIAPGTGSATCTENIVVTKEDLQIRGPGRGQDIKPASGIGVHIQANNCSISGVVIRAPAGSSDDCLVINGKFCRIENLYVVGADTGIVGSPVGTGNGIHFKGGDYHKVINVEVEKCGGDGIKFTDAPMGSEGSPREVLISDCVSYYNRGYGINFTATSANSTRLNFVDACRIVHNSVGGVYMGENVLRTIVRSNNWIKDNGTFPQNGATDPTKEVIIHEGALQCLVDMLPDTMVDRIWSAVASENNTALTMGAKVNAAGTAGDPWGADLSTYGPGTAGKLIVDTKAAVDQIDSITPTQSTMLLEMYELLGLDPTKPLTVTKTSRSVTGINQTIVSDANSTVVTRV
jgi:hypothetical protein